MAFQPILDFAKEFPIEGRSLPARIFERPEVIKCAECPICFEIMMVDPVQCPHCSRTYCRECICEHIDASLARSARSNCPYCDKPLQRDQLLLNRTLQHMIESHSLKCFSHLEHPEGQHGGNEPARKKQRGSSSSKSKNTCDWVGPMNECEEHYRQCPFATVKCPIEGCDASIMRKQLMNHSKICPKRVIICQYCEALHPAGEVEDHHKVCPKKPVPCPNNCHPGAGTICRLEELDAHIKVCPLAIVDCQYKICGCNVRLKRREMLSHEQNGPVHFRFIKDTLQRADNLISASLKKYDILSDENQIIWRVKIDGVAQVQLPDVNMRGYVFSSVLEPSALKQGFHRMVLKVKQPGNRNPNNFTIRYRLEVVNGSNAYVCDELTVTVSSNEIRRNSQSRPEPHVNSNRLVPGDLIDDEGYTQIKLNILSFNIAPFKLTELQDDNVIVWRMHIDCMGSQQSSFVTNINGYNCALRLISVSANFFALFLFLTPQQNGPPVGVDEGALDVDIRSRLTVVGAGDNTINGEEVTELRFRDNAKGFFYQILNPELHRDR